MRTSNHLYMCRMGGFFTFDQDEAMNKQMVCFENMAGFGLQSHQGTAGFGCLNNKREWLKNNTCGVMVFGK